MISLSNISIVFHLDYISIFWKAFPNLPNLSVHSVNLLLLPFVCRAPGPGVTTAKDSKSVLGFQVRKGGRTVSGGCKGWGAQMRCVCAKKTANLWFSEKKSCGLSPGQADSASSSTFIFLRTVKIETPRLECWRPGAELSRLCVNAVTVAYASALRSACFSPYLKDSCLLFTTQPSPLSQMFFTRVEANFKSLLKICDYDRNNNF